MSICAENVLSAFESEAVSTHCESMDTNDSTDTHKLCLQILVTLFANTLHLYKH